MIDFKTSEKIQSDKTQLNGWNEWSKHVLFELQRLNVCYSSLNKRVEDLSTTSKVDIAILKIKSGIWGAIGGLVPICTAIIIAVIVYLVERL